MNNTLRTVLIVFVVILLVLTSVLLFEIHDLKIENQFQTLQIKHLEACAHTDYAPLRVNGKTFCFRGNWAEGQLPAIYKASLQSGIDVITTGPTHYLPGFQAVWIEDSSNDLSSFGI